MTRRERGGFRLAPPCDRWMRRRRRKKGEEGKEKEEGEAD